MSSRQSLFGPVALLLGLKASFKAPAGLAEHGDAQGDFDSEPLKGLMVLAMHLRFQLGRASTCHAL